MPLFWRREYAQAAKLFEEVSHLIPGDKPSAIYLDLCRQCLACAHPRGWQPGQKGAGSVLRLSGPWDAPREPVA